MMIKVKSITLARAEGPKKDCAKPETVSTFHDADWVLRRWSRTAPEHGGYDKCDFTVVYEDGQKYSGRYDLVHWRIKQPDLASHMRQYLECSALRFRPHHFTDASWDEWVKTQEISGFAKLCGDFLDNYQIGTIIVVVRCGNCRWFDWPFGDDVTEGVGSCTWPAERLPYSLRYGNRERLGVEPDEGAGCKCFEAKET